MRTLSRAGAMLIAGLSILVAQTGVDRSWLVRKLPPEETARLEAQLQRDPDDVATRIRLMSAYVASAENERRAHHLLWLIEHHPEADGLATSLFVYSGEGPLQDLATYHRAAELWREVAAKHASDPRVVVNAADFLSGYHRSTDPFQAEQWILRAREVARDRTVWTRQLARHYMLAIGFDTHGPEKNRAFAAHARDVLKPSSDRELLWQTGDLLAHSLGGESPDIAAGREFGQQLIDRAIALGFQPPARPILGSGGPRPASTTLQPIHRVEPDLPASVMQAKLRGVMKLHLWISTRGDVTRAEVVTGHPWMRDPAREAVLQWKYPAQDTGIELDVEVPFGLKP